MFGKKWRRNKKLSKVDAIARKQKGIFLAEEKLNSLSDDIIDLIIANGAMSDGLLAQLGYTFGVDALDGKTPEEVRAEYIIEHPEYATAEEIERQAAEVFADWLRQDDSSKYESYEDERPDFMNAPFWETSADDNKFGTVEQVKYKPNDSSRS